MALAKGHSKIRCGPLTDHTKTAIYVIEKLTSVFYFLDKFSSLINFYVMLIRLGEISNQSEYFDIYWRSSIR